ncbi:hypothetical protein Bbelb_133760 [Branchiostoma belcheri]|nr:hypothetical protein Bbelb_133760 [Branchiostoma belcheri]
MPYQVVRPRCNKIASHGAWIRKNSVVKIFEDELCPFKEAEGLAITVFPVEMRAIMPRFKRAGPEDTRNGRVPKAPGRVPKAPEDRRSRSASPERGRRPSEGRA